MYAPNISLTINNAPSLQLIEIAAINSRSNQSLLHNLPPMHRYQEADNYKNGNGSNKTSTVH